MRFFDKVAKNTATFAGYPTTFIATVIILIGWWWAELPLSIGDISILLVLLVQNTQNRDTNALQAKLDELIAATSGARNTLIAVEKKEGADGVEAKRIAQEECDGKESG